MDGESVHAALTGQHPSFKKNDFPVAGILESGRDEILCNPVLFANENVPSGLFCISKDQLPACKAKTNVVSVLHQDEGLLLCTSTLSKNNSAHAIRSKRLNHCGSP